MKDTIVERVWEYPWLLLHLCKSCLFLQEPLQWWMLRLLRPWIIHDCVCHLQRCAYIVKMSFQCSTKELMNACPFCQCTRDTHTCVYTHTYVMHTCSCTHTHTHTHTRSNAQGGHSSVLFIKMCLRHSPGGAKVGIIINGIKRKIRT